MNTFSTLSSSSFSSRYVMYKTFFILFLIVGLCLLPSRVSLQAGNPAKKAPPSTADSGKGKKKDGNKPLRTIQDAITGEKKQQALGDGSIYAFKSLVGKKVKWQPADVTEGVWMPAGDTLFWLSPMTSFNATSSVPCPGGDEGGGSGECPKGDDCNLGEPIMSAGAPLDVTFTNVSPQTEYQPGDTVVLSVTMTDTDEVDPQCDNPESGTPPPPEYPDDPVTVTFGSSASEEGGTALRSNGQNGKSAKIAKSLTSSVSTGSFSPASLSENGTTIYTIPGDITTDTTITLTASGANTSVQYTPETGSAPKIFLNVKATPTFSVNLTSDKTFIAKGGTIKFTATIPDPPTGTPEYEWTVPNATKPENTEATPSVTFGANAEDVEFEVSVKVKIGTKSATSNTVKVVIPKVTIEQEKVYVRHTADFPEKDHQFPTEINVKLHGGIKTDVPVLFKCASGDIAFTDEDKQDYEALLKKGETVKIKLIGDTTSTEKDKSPISIVCKANPNDVLLDHAATVFDFEPASIKVTVEKDYKLRPDPKNSSTPPEKIDGKLYSPLGGAGVSYKASATVKPVNLDPDVAPLKDLRIGICQTVLPDPKYTIITYHDPDLEWMGEVPKGTTVTANKVIEVVTNMSEEAPDSSEKSNPLYDSPGHKETIDEHSLALPRFKADSTDEATSNDSPGATFSYFIIPKKDSDNKVIAVLTYYGFKAVLKKSFRTWCVTVDLNSGLVIPLREAEWTVNAESEKDDQRAAAGADKPAKNMPLLGAPFAEEISNLPANQKPNDVGNDPKTWTKE